MRTAINIISWGMFVILVHHMTENKQNLETKDFPTIVYVQAKKNTGH